VGILLRCASQNPHNSNVISLGDTVERKYIGVLHPDINLRYVDFLFYDHFQLMENIAPSNPDSELLFESGIIQPMNNKLIVQSLNPNEKNVSLIDSIKILEKRWINIQGKGSIPSHDIDKHEKDKFYGFGKFRHRDSIVKQSDNYNKAILVNKTQACSLFLSQTSGINAIPIIPEAPSLYSEFVSGAVLEILKIGFPIMPIRDLVQFKFDNQDKLRRLRLAINSLATTYDDHEDVFEEISLSLDSYKKTLDLINQKYELEQLEFKFKITEGLAKLLASFSLSPISDTIAMKKSSIQKQLEIEGISTAHVSYLYEVGKLASDRSNSIQI